MTEDVPHFNQTRTRFDHVSRRIVPQVVPFEIGYARLLHEREKTAAQVFVWPPGPGIEEQIICPFCFSSGNETGDSFVSNFIQRNTARFSTLGSGEEDGARLEIDLIDLQAESFAAAHPGVTCQYDE